MSEWTIRHLTEDDNVSDFDCGEPKINQYLKEKALFARKVNDTVTWVIPQGDRIIGFYSSTVGSLSQEEAPRKARGPVHPRPVPMFLIAQLGVDLGFQRRGLGHALVLHALREAIEISDRVGVRMVMLDALNEKAQRFYEQFGFKTFDELSMFTLIKDVRKALGLA